MLQNSSSLLQDTGRPNVCNGTFDPDSLELDNVSGHEETVSCPDEDLCIQFEGDDTSGPEVGESLANYTNQCMRKHIDREKLTQMKQRVTRPGSCDALGVPLAKSRHTERFEQVAARQWYSHAVFSEFAGERHIVHSDCQGQVEAMFQI
eukprot:scpid96469/ scgid35099/ 